MFLTKEATKKDRLIKIQLLISAKYSDEKLSGERVWRSEGYFSDTRPQLNLKKKNSWEHFVIRETDIPFDCERWPYCHVTSQFYTWAN